MPQKIVFNNHFFDVFCMSLHKTFSLSSAFFVFLVFSFVFVFSSLALAEVPEHNPSLDYQCGPGFQWSRGTVACEQANCPPGAGRTYTYECNCGEAWDDKSPLVTCWEDGMVKKCISRGQKCEEMTELFDTLTGNCVSGYKLSDDKKSCVPAGQPTITCTIRDLYGNAVQGVEVNHRFEVEGQTPPKSASLSTGADGTVQVPVQWAKGALSLSVGMQGKVRLGDKITYAPGKKVSCTFTLYGKDDIAPYIQAQLKEFLKNACLPKEMYDKLDNAKIVFTSQKPNSEYDSETKTLYVAEGDLKGDWDTLHKALAHEMGHWVSDNIVDESGWYIKGYPLEGKYTGGAHNTWEPTKKKGKLIDPEELAFEEAFAEFFATSYFRSRGMDYDKDFYSRDKSAEILSKNKSAGTYTEGVIASFLYEYYGNSWDKPDKAARAFGDFYHSTKDSLDWVFTRPPRTAKEFVAVRAKLAKQAQSDRLKQPCLVPDTGNLNGLAGDYGMSGEAKMKPKARVEKIRKKDNPSRLLPLGEISPGKEYVLVRDASQVMFDVSTPDDITQGRMPRFYPDPDRDNKIYYTEDGKQFIVRQGRVYAIDMDASTPHIKLRHLRTAYVVEVDENGDEKVLAINGSVEITHTQEEKTITLEESQQATISADKIERIENVSIESLPASEKWWQAGAESEEPPPFTPPSIPCCTAPAFIFALLAIAVARTRKSA